MNPANPGMMPERSMFGDQVLRTDFAGDLVDWWEKISHLRFLTVRHTLYISLCPQCSFSRQLGPCDPVLFTKGLNRHSKASDARQCSWTIAHGGRNISWI